MAPGACGMSSSSSSLPKRLRSSARSIDSGVVPMMFTPAALSGNENSAASDRELHDHANGRARSFVFADGKHVFERERLEVEAVAGVVIGRDRLGLQLIMMVS